MATEKNIHAQHLEVFYCPDGDGERRITVSYTVYTDGSISLPGELSESQERAILAYLTYENQHMREPGRGASLSIMSDEQSALYWTAGDTFKTSEQLNRERIERFILADHSKTIQSCTPFVSWFEELDDFQKGFFLKDGDCIESDTLYELQVTESYDNKYSYLAPQIDTQYFVSESQAGELQLLIARCNLIKCERYRESLNDE